jgi:hypothetical protein
MKVPASIDENGLDGALNALFLETYSRKEDESMAHFCLNQDYKVPVNSKKEAELLKRLNGKQGGKNIVWVIIAALLIFLSLLFFYNRERDLPASKPEHKTVSPPQQIIDTLSGSNTGKTQATPAAQETVEPEPLVTTSPVRIQDDQQQSPSKDDPASQPPASNSDADPDPLDEKILPYFNKEGLAHFAKVKEQMLQKLVKIDDLLYAKTEPGVTIYKNREVLVSPFVMSNFPVTNLQYKTFLADLAMQGRVDDLKKCLPKTEVWKEYDCYILAKNYFENEAYNDFPVVNVDKEACMIFCEWLEEETNVKLSESSKTSKISKIKAPVKKKQVAVRLPYDYEWIYSADAAYTLIPDCDGYNTIYDASEGLVDKGFFKRTSQVNKRDLRKETRMDKLADVNRFGMTEAEMIAIFKEAMNYKEGSSKSTANPFDPLSYPNNIEASCLAGHVCELIKDKEGGMTVRGCCWKDKEEFLKMMEVYKKNGASPFIGFRVVILNAGKGKDKDPFW